MAGKNAKTYQLTTPPASAPRESQAASLTAFAPAADKPLNIRVLTTPFIAPGSLPDGTRIVGKVIEFRDSPKKDYKGRVFDLHLKDKRVQKTAGEDVSFDTHIGEGQSNLKGLFGRLKASGYAGRLAIETDSQEFARSPDEFVRKAKEFVEGSVR